MRVVGYVNGFAGGELGQEAWERADLQQHAKGMAPGTNLLVLTTGPAVSRGGFWDRGAPKHQDRKARLFGFRKTNADALLLEFGDEYFRVWTPAGDPVLDGPDPVEVATPWGEDDLDGLWFKQIGDLVLVTHQDGLAPYAIARTSNTAWSVAAYDFRDGPWLAENADTAFTIEASAITGSVTLTASQALFTAQHVGATFRLRAQSSGAGMGAWTAGFDVLADYEMVVSDGKVYRTTTPALNNKTGTNQPVHDTGSANDGGMVWEYLHDGAGIVTITAVTDATHATATVSGMLPTQGIDTTPSGADGIRKKLAIADNPAFPATSYWAECAFSAARGWPRANAEEVEERLEFSATEHRPAQLHLTRTAAWTPAYAEFKPNLGTGRIRPDDAVRLTAGKGAAELVWAVKATFLLVGTIDGEYVISGGSIDDAIAPDSHKSTEISRFGVAPIAPVVVHGPPVSVLFVTRSGDVLRDLRVAPDLSTDGDDMTILADHIRARGFAELAWQTPDEICWARTADDGLAAITYHQKHEVRAWTTQELGGGFEVESIATVPYGRGDVLWALVKREKDGETQRRMWRLARRSEQMFIDGAERYQGAAVSAVSGLSQYEGETVSIVADGARSPDVTVTGGAAAVKFAATDITVGLPFTPRFVSLPLDLQGVGSTIGRALQVKHATVTFSCVEARVGDGEEQGWTNIRRRPPTDQEAPQLERIKQRVGIGQGADRDRRVVIEGVGPWDLVIYSLRTEGDAQP